MNYFVGAGLSYWAVAIFATIAALYTGWGKEGYVPVVFIAAFVVNYVLCLIGLLVEKWLANMRLHLKILAFVVVGYFSGVLLVVLFDHSLDLLSPQVLITISGAVLYAVSGNVAKPLWLKYSLAISAPLLAFCSLMYLVLAS